MILGRAMLTAAFVLAPVAMAAAQSPWPDTPTRPGVATVQPPPQTAPPPGFATMGPAPMQAPQAGPPGGMPPCMTAFLPLRQEAEKRAGAIKVAVERKSPREEICKLFGNFSAAEAKLVKFVHANATSCGIPPAIVTQMKSNHDRTVKTKTQVCATAGPANGPPPGPSLSDALSAPPPSAANTKTGRGGTFDTLTGNPIK